MTKIHKTKDYSMFKIHRANREQFYPHLKNITNSIKLNNLLAFRPIVVDKDLNVIDGQHRLEAAKRLGVEIYYQIKEDTTMEDITCLNVNQRVWHIADWVHFYTSLGYEEYIKLKDYCEKTQISETSMIKIMKNFGKNERFRQGDFKFPVGLKFFAIDESIKNMNDLVTELKPYLLSKSFIVEKERFKVSLCLFLLKPEVNFEKFKKRMIMKCDSIRLCYDNMSYQDMFTKIYNFHNQKGIEDESALD